MNTQQLISENNRKREFLTKENKEYYEDMLVYIRLSFDKSDQETEEVLNEMLDHVLLAQEEGRTAKDIFGSNPKQYADEVIGELPRMVTKKQLQYFVMGIFYLLAAWVGMSGIISTGAYYLFHVGELYEDHYLVSQILILLISIPLAFLYLILTLQYIRWSTFKSINRVGEFLLLWLIGMLSFGVFFLIYYFMPDIGPNLQLPAYIKIIIGVILFIFGRILYKRI
ncbi:DUF1129 family protein [Piscibacillus halophilus]|uniref:Uncharacterized membrane-anchored protein n=1 Tax=Piscibacillus halophilus TaxID=571933 RepID=A0A1H9F219_9BACI|nr:DUF1129 family protein [Piscibacillus halophilus]SEQ31927.1 Uncharacterized membrane-anchored protein [Piscibacillus halophilus]